MNTIICNKCQCDNTTDAKFCRGCNGKICSVCHKTNDHDAKFCVYCGNEFTQSPVPPRPPYSYTPPPSPKKDNSESALIATILIIGAVGFFILLLCLKDEFPNEFKVVYLCILACVGLYKFIKSLMD